MKRIGVTTLLVVMGLGFCVLPAHANHSNCPRGYSFDPDESYAEGLERRRAAQECEDADQEFHAEERRRQEAEYEQQRAEAARERAEAARQAAEIERDEAEAEADDLRDASEGFDDGYLHTDPPAYRSPPPTEPVILKTKPVTSSAPEESDSPTVGILAGGAVLLAVGIAVGRRTAGASKPEGPKPPRYEV